MLSVLKCELKDGKRYIIFLIFYTSSSHLVNEDPSQSIHFALTIQNSHQNYLSLLLGAPFLYGFLEAIVPFKG